MDALTLRNARVLVTGGAGLIGSHIVDRLVAEPAAEIVVLDNFVRGKREHLASAEARGRVTVVEGDIRDRELVAEVMDGIDVVFHQAAIRITQCAEEPELAVDVLVNGTLNILQAAVKSQVKKIVAASSASVYGLADRFPTDERHHGYNNRTLYGAAKMFNEGMLRAFNDTYGLEYVALRYFNVYGARMDTCGAYTEVFIRWMEAIENGQSPVIFGDGLQTMDFVYVDDVARANLMAARAPVTDAVYNIGSGSEVSLKECAELMLETMGARLPIQYAPARKVNPVPRRLSDPWRAQDELGFQALVSFDEGVEKLVAWWRAQRKAAAFA
jgi:nucleoside-diphosphate-sugar epimerase